MSTTQSELLGLARDRLNDLVRPYLWEDAELLIYANAALQQICKKALLVSDSTTAAICDITLDITPSSVATYALDSRILRIRKARLVTTQVYVAPITLHQLEILLPFWENDTTPATPRYMITDLNEGMITLYPTPEVAETLHMHVYRKPIKIQDNVSTMEPACLEAEDLIDGILQRAYLKKDSQTYDPEQSRKHGLVWEERMEQIKTDRLVRDYVPDFVGIDQGAL